MKARVIHDTHIGVNRTAGTTPTSQLLLRKHVLAEFEGLLPADGQDLILLGDLYDSYQVPLSDVLGTLGILYRWLAVEGHGRLYLVPGNHDLSKTSNQLSSFEFSAEMLRQAFPNKVTVVMDSMMTPYGYIIPHVPNQDLFNHELEQVPECNILFLHCNYDNNFAAQSDQSLNISREQVVATKATKIVLAHEHHPRKEGRVIVPGNQIATSVSDWLQDGDKYFVEVDTDGSITHHHAASRDVFTEMQVDQLEVTDHKFVRIVGTIPEDGGNYVSAMAKLRQQHPAFVITNATKSVLAGDDTGEKFAKSLDSINKFSIWSALEKLFTKKQLDKLREAESKQ